MLKRPKNRTAEIKVHLIHEDVNGITYHFSANVTINRDYEIESATLLDIEAYDKNDERIEPVMGRHLKDTLECIAGVKALGKCEDIDFEKDYERE